MGAATHPSLPYLAGEAVWAARHEAARCVQTCSLAAPATFSDARASIEAAGTVAALLAQELGRVVALASEQTAEFTKLAAVVSLTLTPEALHGIVRDEVECFVEREDRSAEEAHHPPAPGLVAPVEHLKLPALSLAAQLGDRDTRILAGQDVTCVILADGHAASLLSVECLDPAFDEVEDHRAFGDGSRRVPVATTLRTARHLGGFLDSIFRILIPSWCRLTGTPRRRPSHCNRLPSAS